MAVTARDQIKSKLAPGARTWQGAVARLVLPLLLAGALILLEKPITALARVRPAVIPVAMVALLAGLLMHRVRRWLIVLLCFGIALMALRDTFRVIPLPPQIDYVFANTLYPFAWGTLALLAALAGAGEAVMPGTVWVRRCYFGAAALYLVGRGTIGYLRYPNYESLILLTCGALSFIGVFTATRVIAAEEPPPPEPEDIQALDEDLRRRAEAVAAREWKAPS